MKPWMRLEHHKEKYFEAQEKEKINSSNPD